MKNILAVFVLFIPSLIFGQSKHQKYPKDSINYYNVQLNKLSKTYSDSLKHSKEYILLHNNIKRLTSDVNSYWGITIFGEILHTDYSKLNKYITQNGFKPLKSILPRIGIEITDKHKRRMFDFYFAVLGFSNESKKGDEKIESNLINVCQFNWGYDLLNSKRISIYPYAGLSIRLAYLNYSKSAVTNTAYTDITNIIITNQSAKLSSTKLGYQIGLGFDYSLSNNTKINRSIFFTKIAMDNPIGEDKYKKQNIDYKPGIRHGDWLISLGLKMVFSR